MSVCVSPPPPACCVPLSARAAVWSDQCVLWPDLCCTGRSLLCVALRCAALRCLRYGRALRWMLRAVVACRAVPRRAALARCSTRVFSTRSLGAVGAMSRRAALVSVWSAAQRRGTADTAAAAVTEPCSAVPARSLVVSPACCYTARLLLHSTTCPCHLSACPPPSCCFQPCPSRVPRPARTVAARRIALGLCSPVHSGLI